MLIKLFFSEFMKIREYKALVWLRLKNMLDIYLEDNKAVPVPCSYKTNYNLQFKI